MNCSQGAIQLLIQRLRTREAAESFFRPFLCNGAITTIPWEEECLSYFDEWYHILTFLVNPIIPKPSLPGIEQKNFL
jgi:hypothetical protein